MLWTSCKSSSSSLCVLRARGNSTSQSFLVGLFASVFSTEANEETSREKSHRQHHFKWYYSLLNRKEGTIPVGSGFWRCVQQVPLCLAGRFLETLSERDRRNQALGRLPTDYGQRKGQTQGVLCLGSLTQTSTVANDMGAGISAQWPLLQLERTSHFWPALGEMGQPCPLAWGTWHLTLTASHSSCPGRHSKPQSPCLQTLCAHLGRVPV